MKNCRSTAVIAVVVRSFVCCNDNDDDDDDDDDDVLRDGQVSRVACCVFLVRHSSCQVVADNAGWRVAAKSVCIIGQEERSCNSIGGR